MAQATKAEILAHMVSYASIRTDASGNKNALDSLKKKIGVWLDDNPEEELEDLTTEITAHWQHPSGGKALQISQLTDEVIIWAARLGLLEGNMGAIAAQPKTDREMVSIDAATVELQGTRYIDVRLPTWDRRQQLKQIYGDKPSPAATTAANIAAANRQAAAPPPGPAPDPTPIRPAPAATAQPPQWQPPGGERDEDPTLAVCPTHRRSRQSSKHQGVYCPEKTADGWCTWKSTASA